MPTWTSASSPPSRAARGSWPGGCSKRRSCSWSLRDRRARAVALESLPLILFPKSSGFRQYLEQRFVARRQAFNVKMETDNVEAIKSFVTVGLGASFLPLATVAEDLRRGSLLRVEPRGLGSLRRRTAVLWRQERKPTLAMQSFLAIVAGRSTAPRRVRR